MTEIGRRAMLCGTGSRNWRKTQKERDENTRLEIAGIESKLAQLHGREQLRRQTHPAISETVELRGHDPADAEPGPREMRVETARGVSNPLRFCVGRLPEFCEQEPELVTGIAGLPQPGPLPAPRSRRISRCRPWSTGRSSPASRTSCDWRERRFTPGDADRYRFEARKGQTVGHRRQRAGIDPLPGRRRPRLVPGHAGAVRCPGQRIGLRRRLPLPSRSGPRLRGPGGRAVRGRNQGRHLPRPAGFRLSHHHRRDCLSSPASSRWAARPAGRPPSS